MTVNLIKLFMFIAQRFKEPCSYAGLGIMLHSIEQQMQAFHFDINATMAGVAGLIAFLLPAKVEQK